MNNNLTTIPYDELKGLNPVSKKDSMDKRKITTLLSHKHMVETLERFKWENLPDELPQDLIERILYFRFKGALFKENDRFYFLPFALKGEIDSYGRYIGITPVLFTGQWQSAGDGKKGEDIAFMTDKHYQVVYDLSSKDVDEAYSGHAVILNDSSLAISQDYTPMNILITPLIEQMTDILVLVNIDLVTSAKVFYIVAKDEAQKEAIENEMRGLDQKILNGQRVVVVTSATQLQELTGQSAKDTARYFQSYQSIDNIRKDIIGMSNGGTFMKQEHSTEVETMTNKNNGTAIIENALRQRQEFCEIANKVFGTSISVSLNQNASDQLIEKEGEQTKDRRGDNEDVL